MDDNDLSHKDVDDDFKTSKANGLCEQKKNLLEEQMKKEDLVNYLVRIQNVDFIASYQINKDLEDKPKFKKNI